MSLTKKSPCMVHWYFRETQQTNLDRYLCWDEDSRLTTVKDEFSLSSYLYDAGPNRVWQLTGDIDRMWINGHEFIDRATLDNVTMYASPEITISGHEYTKHYFMGSERIASNFGSGFANAVTPVSGTQTLISNPQGSLQIISNQLVDKLFRSWDCVGMIPEYVELQTDISVFNDLDAIDNEYNVYFFHPDHLGSTSWILTGSTPIQHLQYLPFGEDYISEQNVNSTFNTNFTFSGKERDVATGYSYFGFRYYDPNTSIWLSVDPLADKYPSFSPYAYCFNAPIVLTDPDGREPVPAKYALLPFFKLKPTQWYEYAPGRYHSKSFNSAAAYCTQRLISSAFQSVYQRNAYYGWVQNQLNEKGINSKWFGAAKMVTSLNTVGATELPNLWVIKDNTEAFLKAGNKYLLPHNMKNAKELLSTGKISGGFVDAYGNKQSFDGLSGISLDMKLVEFEQSLIQIFISNYEGGDLNSIIENINSMFTGLVARSIGPSAINDVMDKHFNGGSTFNFNSYADRVKLGQELIKKAHNE